MVDRLTSPVTRLRGREKTGESDVRRVRQSRRTDVLTLNLFRTNGRGLGRSARPDLFGFAWRWLNRRMCVGNDSVSAPRFLDQLLVGDGPFTLTAVALHRISYQQSRTIELSPRLPQITFVTPLACIVFAWFKTWLITSCSVGV